MTAQYLRNVQLKVLDDTGAGLDLSKLKITFQTTAADVQTPNTALIRIYNLAEETRLKLRREGTKVELKCSYGEDPPALIFSGQIKRFVNGSEAGGIDRFLEIQAADSDGIYRYSIVNAAVAAGHTPAAIRDQLLSSFREQGASGLAPGSSPPPEGQAAPRGAVLSGSTRTLMRRLIDAENANWSLQNGQVQIIKRNGFLPGDTIVLTARTGLIGIPEQTPEGVVITCLLNPAIQYGRRVAIDNKSVNEARFNLGYGGDAANALIPQLNDDGIYRVITVEHKGDTYGQQWYTVMVCLSINGAVPGSLTNRGLG